MFKASSYKKKWAYVVGVALGDGNLSNPNGRAVRLRVSCDTKYKNLISKICIVIKDILPNNKVSLVNKKGKNCVDISCYSNKWEGLLGWKVGHGSKYEQNASVPFWIKKSKGFSIECLRGLLETDGCIYFDRGYKMVHFTNKTKQLSSDVCSIMEGLGFTPHIYQVKERGSYRYNVRLSKNVDRFIKLINLKKD